MRLCLEAEPQVIVHSRGGKVFWKMDEAPGFPDPGGVQGAQFQIRRFSALLLARVHRKMEARESLGLVSQRKEHTRRGKNFNALKWRKW